jgi:hypothetical protein
MMPLEADDADAFDQIMAWPADAPFPSWTELVESGRAWNEHIKSIPHKDSKRPSDRRGFGARPRNDPEEEEPAGDDEATGPDPEIAAFLEAARKKHEAYWAARPHGGGKTLIFDLKGASR